MILDKIVSILTGGLVDKIADVAKSYFNKQISEAEFRSRVEIAMQDASKEVEKAWLDAATKQYAEFQQTARQSPVIARAYAAVIVSQLFVLLWYQWGASAFMLITGQGWPSAGATVDWAYAILALCLGGGAFVFRGKAQVP
jgi:hypothetical protein